MFVVKATQHVPAVNDLETAERYFSTCWALPFDFTWTVGRSSALGSSM